MSEDVIRLDHCTLTEQGQNLVDYIVLRFTQGGMMEDIAEEVEVPVGALQILMQVEANDGRWW